MKTKSQKILLHLLAIVPSAGWTDDAFAQAASRAGVGASEARKLFPQGITDAVEAFHCLIDEAMEDQARAKRSFAAKRVREKIALLVRARLEFLAPHKASMRRLLIWSLSPRHLKQSTRRLWQTADRVWLAAGDTSTDYNYYTKRLLLIAVMKSTLSFWLNDTSSDHKLTWEFLDRRIEDVLKVGKGIGVLKTVGVGDIVSFVRSKIAA